MRPSVSNGVLVLLALFAGTLHAQSYPAKPMRFVVPELPALAEMLPGYVAVQWWGVLAPAKTPPDIVNRMHGELTRILASEDMKPRLADQAATLSPMSADAFTRFFRDEIAKWRKVVKALNLQA